MKVSEGFAALWDAHVLAGWERQLNLDERVAGGWEIDLTVPSVSFGGALTTEAQLLGTWSAQSDTWLWSWANPSGLPEVCSVAARALQRFGEEHGIPEFTEASFGTDRVEPFQLAMVAVGLLGGAGYRRCPYDGGEAVVLLTDTSLYEAPEIPMARLVTVLGQVLGQAELPNPVASLAAWSALHDLTVVEEPGRVRVTSPEGDEAFLSQDEEGRIVDISASLAGRG